MHPRPSFLAQSSTQCFPFSPYLSLSLTHACWWRLDGSFALNLLFLLLSSRVEDFLTVWRTRQLLRERRPWSSPDLGALICVRVCVCVHEQAHAFSTSFRRVSRSFVRMYVRSVLKSRWKANSGKGRRQGVVAISRTAKHIYLVEKFLPRSLCCHCHWHRLPLSAD